MRAKQKIKGESMIPSGIDPHQKIYRFLNFFDLFKLIKDREIRFTKLHKLDDKNEGLGKILRSIELSPAFPINSESLKKTEYPIAKHTTYVSCWTTVPDNIAMWSLYSPDKSGIRIKTTTLKLYNVMKNYKDKYSGSSYRINDFLPSQLDVFKMDYKDLRKTKNEIEANTDKAMAAMREAIKGKSKPDAIRAWYKTMREHLQDNVLENDAMKYKDEKYSHEQEIRGQIEFEAANEGAYDYLCSQVCEFGEFPDFIFPTVNNDFIEEICFDPRCEEYKIEVFKKIISPKGNINIVASDAFGVVF